MSINNLFKKILIEFVINIENKKKNKRIIFDENENVKEV
jgi:hypothetical protein